MSLHVIRTIPLPHRRRRSRLARLRRWPADAFLIAFTGIRLMRLLGRLWRG